jgi:hypothetical protein
MAKINGKSASATDYEALIAATKKCAKTDDTIAGEKLSLIRGQINYGLWKPYADKMVAPLFTDGEVTEIVTITLDTFGKDIGMGELGCIPKYFTAEKCKGATSMDFKGTIA